MSALRVAVVPVDDESRAARSRWIPALAILSPLDCYARARKQSAMEGLQTKQRTRPTRASRLSLRRRTRTRGPVMHDVISATRVHSDRRSRRDSHPLAGTPLRRSEVLHAVENTCSTSGHELINAQVEVAVETREGRLTIGLRPSQRFAKRALDLGTAIVLLPLCLPVLAAAAALIKVSSRGPTFFRQERVGYRGKTFHIYKFRTMVVDAERQLLENPALRETYKDNGCKLPPELDPANDQSRQVAQSLES